MSPESINRFTLINVYRHLNLLQKSNASSNLHIPSMSIPSLILILLRISTDIPIMCVIHQTERLKTLPEPNVFTSGLFNGTGRIAGSDYRAEISFLLQTMPSTTRMNSSSL